MLLVETFQFKQENKMKEGVIEKKILVHDYLDGICPNCQGSNLETFMKKQVTDSIRKKLPALNVVQ